MSVKSIFRTVGAWRTIEALLSDMRAASTRLAGGRAGFISVPRGIQDGASMRSILRLSWKTPGRPMTV
jgi:hypothetical protein